MIEYIIKYYMLWSVGVQLKCNSNNLYMNKALLFLSTIQLNAHNVNTKRDQSSQFYGTWCEKLKMNHRDLF